MENKSHSFQISQGNYILLMQKAQRLSPFTKPDWIKTFKEPAEQKISRAIAAVERQEHQHSSEDARYILPERVTVEQHLFNLAFNEPGRPIKVIDYAFRQYNPVQGHWEALNEELLEQRILAIAEKARYPDTKRGRGRSLATCANIEKTLKFAAKKLFHDAGSINNRHLVAFRNGIVDVRTGKLSKHDPEAYLTTSLPYEYRPNSACPEPMQRYIDTSFGEDQHEYVRAALGLVLDFTAPDKFIHCIGTSGSGKGVFTRLVMKFFGQESVGSPDNFKLFAQPDQVHQYLSGKRLIAIDDIVGFIGEEIGRFYTAVERTAMNARCLFKPKGYTQPFDIRYTVASTSQLPTKYSNSKGWERRVFPLATIGGRKEDDTLESELENCIAEIISWALSMDKIQRNAILKHPERYSEGAEEYFREAAFSSSSAWAFIEECLQPIKPSATDTTYDQTPDHEAHIYACYKAYCGATGRQPMGLDGLKHEMRDALPANWIDRRRGGREPRRFAYIQVRSGAFTTTEFGSVVCDLTHIGYDGIAEFKEWARTYGSLHPYKHEDLLALNSQQELPVQPVQAMHPQNPDQNHDSPLTQEEMKEETQMDQENSPARPAQATQEHPVGEEEEDNRWWSDEEEELEDF